MNEQQKEFIKTIKLLDINEDWEFIQAIETSLLPLVYIDEQLYYDIKSLNHEEKRELRNFIHRNRLNSKIQKLKEELKQYEN